MFATNFNDAIEGRSKGTIEVNELYGGARVAYIFKDVFGFKAIPVLQFKLLMFFNVFIIFLSDSG